MKENSDRKKKHWKIKIVICNFVLMPKLIELSMVKDQAKFFWFSL